MTTSCWLLHVSLDLDAEKSLPPGLAGRLAFARQKVGEVVLIGRALTDGREAISAHLAAALAISRHALSDDIRLLMRGVMIRHPPPSGLEEQRRTTIAWPSSPA